MCRRVQLPQIMSPMPSEPFPVRGLIGGLYRFRRLSRAVWVVSLLVVWLLAAMAATSNCCRAEDWPRWRGPRADGTWSGPAVPASWPENGLPELWRRPVGGGYSGVIVASGRVYVTDHLPADSEADQPEVERVLCFDAATGDDLWTHAYQVAYGELDYGSGPRAAPTYHGGLLYTLGAMGHVFCLNVRSGETVWSHDLVAENRATIPEWGLAASPVICGDRVVIHSGGPSGACYMALDRHTGEELWRAGDDPAGYATPILIDRSESPLLVAWSPLRVLGIDPADGAVHWRVPYEVTYGVSIATPIYHEGLVFVSGYWEGSKAIRLADDGRRAELAWEENRNLRGLMSQPLYREGHVYLLDKHHGLTCFELTTGRKLWDDENQATPRGRNPQASLVWWGSEGHTLIFNSEGQLILARLSPQGYEELSRADIIGPSWAHPAYAGRAAFARDDTELVAVELVPESQAASAGR